MGSRRVGHDCDFTFTFHFHALEKEMAAHCSILAWRIPGTGAWWAVIYGVTQSWTWLMWLSSSSSNHWGKEDPDTQSRSESNPQPGAKSSKPSFVWWISADLQTHEWKMNSCFMSSCFKITHYASISVAVTVLSNLKIWEVYLEFGLIWRMVERIKSFSKFFSYYWNP